MKYTYEIKLKAVKSIKKGILIDEPYNKISRQWRDSVKYWKKYTICMVKMAWKDNIDGIHIKKN